MVPLWILQEIEAQIKRQFLLNLFWTYHDPPSCRIVISSIFIDIKDSSIIFHPGCLAKHDSLETTPVLSDPIRLQIRLIQSGSRYVLADPIRVQIGDCWSNQVHIRLIQSGCRYVWSNQGPDTSDPIMVQIRLIQSGSRYVWSNQAPDKCLLTIQDH